MKRAFLFAFSRRGMETAWRIASGLAPAFDTQVFRPAGNLPELTARAFREADALIFVSACGIAVRAVAPFLRGKEQDPAVVAVDERCGFAVSLLSGHIGGANALARRIAALTGAQAVITTATDVNGRFAVDEWAARQGLILTDLQAAKRFAAEILERDLPIVSDFPLCGELPPGLIPGAEGGCGLAVTCKAAEPFPVTVRAVPRVLCLGVGCRRGTSAEAIRQAVAAALKAFGLDARALCGIASIDLKREEAGLLTYAEQTGLPLAFYAADRLRGIKGDFTASSFVEETVGVDNVCERAAVCLSGEGGRLIVPKQASGGVTVAAAVKKWSVCFE